MPVKNKEKKELYLLEQKSKWPQLILLVNKRKEKVKTSSWIRKIFKKRKKISKFSYILPRTIRKQTSYLGTVIILINAGGVNFIFGQ